MQQRFLKSSLILRSFRHASQVSSAPKPISRALSFPSSLENILRQDSILVHRQYEMLNIFLGYEQHNKYNITNAEGMNLGYILEENTFWRVILRQVIGTHRPLKAVVLDPQGQVLLEVKRPWTFINSRLSVLYSDKNLIGEVHQVWHLWRRRYELFLRWSDTTISISSGFIVLIIGKDNSEISMEGS
jgi:Scramblase